MYLTNGKDYYAVQDEAQIAKLKKRGYTEITAAEVVRMKAGAIANYVQQSDLKNSK